MNACMLKFKKPQGNLVQNYILNMAFNMLNPLFNYKKTYNSVNF